MNYPRLPKNIYSYRASIFGIPLGDALIISTFASASLLGLRISIYSPLISVAFVPWFVLHKGRHSPGSITRLKMRRKRFNTVITSRIIIHNNHSFVFTEGYAQLFYEIEGVNILGMRVSTQRSIIERMRIAIEDAGTDLDLFTTHDNGSQNLRHITYVRLSKRITKSDDEVGLNGLSSIGQVFQDSLISVGIWSEELTQEKRIERLINSLIA